MRKALPESIVEELNVTRRGTSPVEHWRTFSERDWTRCLRWLDYSGLAIYFLEKLSQSGRLNILPSPIRQDLEKRRANNSIRTEAILRELTRFTEAFKQARVNYAILKGLALVPDYCPDAALRTQYDHDVLVDAASIDAAERVLQNAGYRHKSGTRDGHCIVYRRPEPRIRFAHDTEGLYSPDLGRSIELHLNLWEDAEEKIYLNLPNDFLSRRKASSWKRWNFDGLCDEDSLLFQILHAFKHILRNWCRLSIFLEIAMFLERRASDAAFWDRFATRIQTVRWAPEASLVVLTLADQIFGVGMPPHLSHLLTTRRAPALGLWIEKYGRDAAVFNFHRDKCSLFLHREFIERDDDWTAIRRRRLFPIQRPHRPPAVVFQRGFSTAGRLWLENVHALKRLAFHSRAGLRYAFEYPRWLLWRRLALAESRDT